MIRSPPSTDTVVAGGTTGKCCCGEVVFDAVHHSTEHKRVPALAGINLRISGRADGGVQWLHRIREIHPIASGAVPTIRSMRSDDRCDLRSSMSTAVATGSASTQEQYVRRDGPRCHRTRTA